MDPLNTRHIAKGVMKVLFRANGYEKARKAVEPVMVGADDHAGWAGALQVRAFFRLPSIWPEFGFQYMSL